MQYPNSTDTQRVYSRSLDCARAGIRRGCLSKDALFRNAAWLAHCERGRLHLLDAHMLALEATRAALAEAEADERRPAVKGGAA